MSSNDFKQVEDIYEFNGYLIKSYDGESDERYFLEVDIQYPENLYNLHNDLSILPEIIKIGKVEKLVANLHNKVEYVIQVKNLKQALNHGLTLKKVHGIIKFNQKKLFKTIQRYEDRSKKNIFKNIYLN